MFSLKNFFHKCLFSQITLQFHCLGLAGLSWQGVVLLGPGIDPRIALPLNLNQPREACVFWLRSHKFITKFRVDDLAFT